MHFCHIAGKQFCTKISFLFYYFLTSYFFHKNVSILSWDLLYGSKWIIVNELSVSAKNSISPKMSLAFTQRILFMLWFITFSWMVVPQSDLALCCAVSKHKMTYNTFMSECMCLLNDIVTFCKHKSLDICHVTFIMCWRRFWKQDYMLQPFSIFFSHISVFLYRCPCMAASFWWANKHPLLKHFNYMDIFSSHENSISGNIW